jgi:nicotinate dehydrogenase subunit A
MTFDSGDRDVPLAAREIGFTLNNVPFRVTADPGARLLYVLRNEAGLNGPKYGCGLGQCGACTVLIDGLAARSCVWTLAGIEGRAVTTLEGLRQADGSPGLVQRAFIAGQGAQCGYCVNGMIVTAHALLAQVPAPDRATIAEALRYNLCRCGTHVEIIRSVEIASETLAQGGTL